MNWLNLLVSYRVLLCSCVRWDRLKILLVLLLLLLELLLLLLRVDTTSIGRTVLSKLLSFLLTHLLAGALARNSNLLLLWIVGKLSTTWCAVATLGNHARLLLGPIS